ncbi:MAG TPA: hypothetical protein DEQ28_07230 [Clostridiales bacterium]|nr:hypothetical protein [Clostridiales bacterium]
MLPEPKAIPVPDACRAGRRRARRDWQARTNPLLRNTLARPDGRRRPAKGNVRPAGLVVIAGLVAVAGAWSWLRPFVGPAGPLTERLPGAWPQPWLVTALRVAGTAAAGILSVWGLRQRRRHRRPPPARAPRLPRHLLRTRGLAAALHRQPRVYVDDLEDLLRLAAAERRPVLGSSAQEPLLYCVIAPGVAYVHVPDARSGAP